MEINNSAKKIHELAIEKGWHSDDETEDQFIERTCNNLHDEVSELHDAWRNNKLHSKSEKDGLSLSYLEEELADIIIRVLDASVKLKVDIELAILTKYDFNVFRSHRHGNKRS